MLDDPFPDFPDTFPVPLETQPCHHIRSRQVNQRTGTKDLMGDRLDNRFPAVRDRMVPRIDRIIPSDLK